MTPTPFTGETLRHIHQQAMRGVPAPAIAAELHWPLPQLARIVRDHRIALKVPDGTEQPVKVRRVASPPEPGSGRMVSVEFGLKAQWAQECQRQSDARGIFRSRVLGGAIAYVLADGELVECISSRGHGDKQRTSEPALVHGYMPVGRKNELCSLARTNGVSRSAIANACVEIVTCEALWDLVLGGEVIRP